MKVFPIFLFILFSQLIQAQVTGVWKGLLIRDGQKPEQGEIVYFDLDAMKSREELPGKDAFIVKRLSGTWKNGELDCKQTISEKKKDIFGNRWCTLNFKLKYMDSTGYLSGTFSSLECKGNTGKVLCFKTDEKLTTDPVDIALQSWRPIFIDDIKNNRKSREKRDEERSNFKFQPIYFDFDKSDIKEEFKPFLLSIIHVINGHTDLRVKVTGNTDAVGSNLYNDGLSERRAQVIIDFFVANGLKRDRIVIDFKGEKNPVSDNNSEEGKQKNRRVDFEFI